MIIEINSIQKSFVNLDVISDLELNLFDNKIYSILGPSGCGKSTILNMISGLLFPDSGKITIAEGKRIGYMLQENLLLPWRTLKENSLLGVEILNDHFFKNENEINKYFDLFDLSGYENYYPNSLSGGMKQRAALIRTLLFSPDILLLDEPFSNLDYDIKLKVQNYILEYFYKKKATILLVTHDIEDAIALSDKIFILSEKPSSIKKTIDVDLGLQHKNPIEARLSPKFNSYFKEIWEELKYLG